MGLLARGQTWLTDTLLSTEGVSVTIRRGGTSTTGVTAIVGKTEAIEDRGDGVQIESQSRDYLIKVAAYKIGGVPVEPQSGDRIEESIAGGTVVYEVLPFAGEPKSRYFDRAHVTWRIHTKRAG